MKALLIAPLSFYSFSDTISNELKKRGYKVEVICDEHPNNIFMSFISKIGLNVVVKFLTRKYFQKYLTSKTYDLILIIKGRGIDSKSVKLFKKKSKKVLGYHFDSLNYEYGLNGWIKDVDSANTFDYQDSIKHNMNLIELFSFINPNKYKDDRYRSIFCSAIVRNHSDRLKFIDKVFSNFLNKKTFIYIYEKNIFSYLFNMLRHPILFFKYRNFIHTKPLKKELYEDVISKSEYTVDYAHPKQTGTTIRCFEAAALGTRVITNNKFISKSLVFNKGMFNIYDELPKKNLNALLNELINEQRLSIYRSTEDFIDDILAS